jgi:hypothetical protein
MTAYVPTASPTPEPVGAAVHEMLPFHVLESGAYAPAVRRHGG